MLKKKIMLKQKKMSEETDSMQLNQSLERQAHSRSGTQTNTIAGLFDVEHQCLF
jgi:hypothetical protein